MTMSLNLKNDGLVGLQNAMVINDDNYAKNLHDDVAILPLLPRQKSSRRIVSKGINLAATMQSSSPAGLRVNITNGSLLITTRRSSPLYRLGGKDGSSPSGSLLVSSGTDSDTADSFAATFAPKCDNDGDDDDDDIGLVIIESLSMINLDAHLTHEEVMFGVPEVDDSGLMVKGVIFDNVDTPIESLDDAKTEEEDDVDEATISLEDVLVSDLSNSEEMGGMPSLPEPDPIRYFLMDHPLYPELQ